MRHPLRNAVGLTIALVMTIGLIIQGCHDHPDATAPDLVAAAAARRTLKVAGAGTGSGSVNAPAIGGAAALACKITAGTYDPIECTKSYAINTSVKLTAVPVAGSAFSKWGGECSASGKSPNCTIVLSKARAVKATFTGSAPKSFTLNVTGSGNGGGTVTSQTGLTPNINCTISSGNPPSGNCSGSYPSGTAVTLTALPAASNTFDGWTGNCTGTGTCSVTLSANRAVTATFSKPGGTEATFGSWAAARSTPVIGLHLSLLPTGKALMWGHGGEPQLWDPASGSFTQKTDQTCANGACELFCSGHTLLSDGRLMAAGGHNEALGNNNGLTQASIFDGTSWQATGSMTYARWYPTLVTLGDGNVVALSGNQGPGLNASIPERWNGSTWTALTGADQKLPLYPRVFVEPKNGNVFMAGEAVVRILDPSGTGSWSNGPVRIVPARNYGPAVMVDGKVLAAGGGGSDCPALPERSAEVIDLNAGAPSWSLTGSMAFRRRHANLTVLPDGKVLVTGGTSACGFSDEAGAVFAAESWDPATGQWTTLASASVVRVYHSTTALLPDGRVLSTGSGDGGGVTQQHTYEIYSPPYLFKGARPTYDLGSTSMHYGQTFDVTTPDAASIGKVTLIRLASSTHASDMSQRLNTLSFVAATDGHSITVTAPPAGRIAPPGPYMLFILNQQGVPSSAQVVTLSQ